MKCYIYQKRISGMKCPKCKKPSGLQTKRTFANGRTVKRERYCRKCKSRFVTVEQFQVDMEAYSLAALELKDSVVSQRDNLSQQLEVYRDLFRTLGKAIKEAGK
ncbi:MAG: hypothetical protein Q8K02_13375 [Flavobacterium sp.]|nr:hypothetical protein [Flavobacterium sp.]